MHCIIGRLGKTPSKCQIFSLDVTVFWSQRFCILNHYLEWIRCGAYIRFWGMLRWRDMCNVSDSHLPHGCGEQGLARCLLWFSSDSNHHRYYNSCQIYLGMPLNPLESVHDIRPLNQQGCYFCIQSCRVGYTEILIDVNGQEIYQKKSVVLSV